jgi:hypothetical protein
MQNGGKKQNCPGTRSSHSGKSLQYGTTTLIRIELSRNPVVKSRVPLAVLITYSYTIGTPTGYIKSLSRGPY